MPGIEDDLSAAFDQVTATTETPVATEVAAEPSSEPATSERSRDEKGRFAAKAEEAKEPAETQPETSLPAETPVEPPIWAKRPNTWRKDMDPHWGTLPEDVRKYVYEREGDMRKGRFS